MKAKSLTVTAETVVKKQKRKVKTYWYVEPLNPATNNSVAAELAKTSDISEVVNLDIGDGVPRSAYLLPAYKMVSTLYASRGQFDFKFRIYRRQGLHGKIIEWIFGEKKKKIKVKL